MFLLSSIERVKRFLCLDTTTDPKNIRVMKQYLSAVSAQVEAYLNQSFELKSRSEFFNIRRLETEFWVKAIPVASITTIRHDFDGLFTGTEQELTDFYIGRGARSVVLDFPETPGKRVLQVTYVGGVSATSSISTYTIGSVSGVFLENKFVEGITSGAYGIIQANASAGSPTLTVDVIAGTFKDGESLQMSTSENGTPTPGVSAIITAIITQSFVEFLPEVATAVELQISYNIRNTSQIEVLDVDKDKTKKRESQMELTFRGAYQDIQPEVRSLINKHRRFIMQT